MKRRCRLDQTQLDGQRHRIAAAQAKRGDAFVRSPLRHGIKQLYQHARAAGADGVAKGDGSAVDVDLGGVQAQFANDGQGLHAESLIQFEEVHIVKRPTGSGGHFAHRVDGREARTIPARGRRWPGRG